MFLSKCVLQVITVYYMSYVKNYVDTSLVTDSFEVTDVLTGASQFSQWGEYTNPF